MKKLYIYCGIMLCLIAVCLVFLTFQPTLFPIVEPQTERVKETEPVPETKPAAPIETNPAETLSSETESPETLPPETEPETVYVCPTELTEAIQINSDVYAWLTIPGTNVNDPVIQSPTNDSYYLRRDINGNYLISGMLMTEHSYNTTTFEDPVTIIYGHCMESGAMFGRLQSYYSSVSGMEQYKTIEVYTPDRKLEYEVFAAVPYDKRHILYNYDFENPRIFSAFFKSIVSIRSFSAIVNSDEKPEYGDKVLILSTCLMGDSSQRYLVMAKLK